MTKTDEHRARLEALAGPLPIIREVIEELDGLESQLRQLQGDLKGARTSRDTWRERARNAERKVGQLKEQLKAERELARMWPRFSDGAPVRIGDEFWWDYSAHRVGQILLYDRGFRLDNEERTCFTKVYSYGEPAERPPLRSKDGMPIEVGQTLYGGDGQSWEVRNVKHGDKYSVCAVGADAENYYELRKLKPEWLTHEKPDSIHAIKVDLNSQVFDYISDQSVVLNAGWLQGIVARLGKLEAKEEKR